MDFYMCLVSSELRCLQNPHSSWSAVQRAGQCTCMEWALDLQDTADESGVMQNSRTNAVPLVCEVHTAYRSSCMLPA